MGEKIEETIVKGTAEKTVANGVVRILMDATEDVIGVHGLRALLNFAKMPYLFENKPDYGYDKNYTDEEYSRIIISYYDLLGISGAKSVFRMIGKAIVKRTTGLGLFDSVKEFPPEERLFKAVELYTMVSGRGRVFMEDNAIVFDNFACSTCFNVKSETPVCTIINGFLDDLAVWSGFTGKRSVETRCKAMGHETCRYEIR
jgi:predicted hydrocarbon binding protein